MALKPEVIEANERLAREQAAAAPRLNDDAKARLRALLKPRTVETSQDAAAAADE